MDDANNDGFGYGAPPSEAPAPDPLSASAHGVVVHDEEPLDLVEGLARKVGGAIVGYDPKISVKSEPAPEPEPVVDPNDPVERALAPVRRLLRDPDWPI